MIAHIANLLVVFVLPLVCGFVLAVMLGERRRLLGLVISIVASILLAYCGLLALVGLTTGSWPDAITPVGLAYALAWFSIPGLLSIAPTALVGYGVGLLVQRARCGRWACRPVR